MPMEDKDKIIASLRQQLREALSKVSALEQEIELLTYGLNQLNNGKTIQD